MVSGISIRDPFRTVSHADSVARQWRQ